MANNRLYLCAVDDDGKVADRIMIAKHMGGEWYLVDGLYGHPKKFVDRIDRFFLESFINCHGISLMDDYMDVPVPAIHVYNDPIEGEGHWEFVKD